MAKQHPWPGKAHHFTYFFTVRRFVAVYRAFVAGRFILPERALLQAFMCVIFQSEALGAKRILLPVRGAAVDANHPGNGIFFSAVH